jgi:hypothetical protein
MLGLVLEEIDGEADVGGREGEILGLREELIDADGD